MVDGDNIAWSIERMGLFAPGGFDRIDILSTDLSTIPTVDDGKSFLIDEVLQFRRGEFEGEDLFSWVDPFEVCYGHHFIIPLAPSLVCD